MNESTIVGTEEETAVPEPADMATEIADFAKAIAQHRPSPGQYLMVSWSVELLDSDETPLQGVNRQRHEVTT